MCDGKSIIYSEVIIYKNKTIFTFTSFKLGILMQFIAVYILRI